MYSVLPVKVMSVPKVAVTLNIRGLSWHYAYLRTLKALFALSF